MRISFNLGARFCCTAAIACFIIAMTSNSAHSPLFLLACRYLQHLFSPLHNFILGDYKKLERCVCVCVDEIICYHDNQEPRFSAMDIASMLNMTTIDIFLR